MEKAAAAFGLVRGRKFKEEDMQTIRDVLSNLENFAFGIYTDIENEYSVKNNLTFDNLPKVLAVYGELFKNIIEAMENLNKEKGN